MHGSIPAAALVAATFAPACQHDVGWSNEDALAAESVELQMDAQARLVEVEYHVLPDRVPATVLAAMDALHPGGQAVAGEKEYVGTTLYWEVTKEIEGREIEAMFQPDGTLHSEEVEVAATDVPTPVQEAVRARLGGEIDKWEEIRDGGQNLVEYHAKIAADGMKYKVMVSTDAVVLGVVREVPAEIEIPVQ